MFNAVTTFPTIAFHQAGGQLVVLVFQFEDQHICMVDLLTVLHEWVNLWPTVRTGCTVGILAKLHVASLRCYSLVHHTGGNSS